MSPAQKEYCPGRAAVENGQVKVAGPSPGEEPAVVVPCEAVVVKVNGNVIEGETKVTEDDNIEVEHFVDVTPGKANVVVSKDKLKAYLEIIPEIKITSVLKSHPFTLRLELETEKKEESYCPFTLNDIMNEIENYGIKNVDKEVVEMFLQGTSSENVEIASGTPPVLPRDEILEVKTSDDGVKKPVLKADGRVDYRSVKDIAGVEKGEVIAEKIPGIPGKPGVDVYGNPADPPGPAEIFITTGENVNFIENEKAVALSSGQPEIKSSGNNYYIDVRPSYTYEGNVDINQGNIRFKGNVNIKGNVEQGTLVSAAQKLSVKGMVSQAVLKSGDEVSVKGHVLASRVEAGAPLSEVKKLITHLEPLYQSLTALYSASLQAFDQLKGNVPAGKVVSLLIERKFTEIPGVIKEINEIISNKVEFSPEVEQLAVDLKQKLWGVNVLKVQEFKEINNIAERTLDIKKYLEMLLENQADVYLQYCLNSIIETTGSVYVTGQGCIDTVIKAGIGVCISGIFRGGSIESENDVTVKEAGSKIGVPTKIKVPQHKAVFITRAHENVNLQIGQQNIQLNKVLYNRKAELDVYGAIVFSSWSSKK
ncbi:MAG: FapA family protein [Clostridiales bacterium]|nr:FapA family protein [Clostridiales bacterium]MCF8021774.1 FapA family protein [Clostridiales bacterium]